MSASDSLEPRDRSIPVRVEALLDAMVTHGAFNSEAERIRFRQIARLLALIYHYEYFGWLEQLRAAYRELDPDRTPTTVVPAEHETAYAALRDALLDLLRGANFTEIAHDEIARAHNERAELPVEVRASLDEFREVRFFRRGRHRETLTATDWFGWRERSFVAEVYDEVVLLVATRLQPVETPRRLWSGRRRLRPGAVLLKSFRNIASADLNALFPNIRVVMSLRDRLILTIPAIAGGIPIVLNLASTLTVLFLVIGFYLGLVGAIKDDEMKTAFAALSGLVALGGFVIRQWVSYQRRALMYQKALSDNFYFRNVNNNAGLFDSLIGAAEEQEGKEALLACFFLLTTRERLTQAALDQRIEQWLAEHFNLDIDFEIADALVKLDQLGLVHRNGEALLIVSMHEILARLERRWTEIFRGDPLYSAA
jgi:hypothetical protein